MNKEIKFYQVGGCVRDEILGLKSKDIDYSVVAPSYAAMKLEIQKRGGEIFLENPEFLTIRAKVPGMGACDFVCCRKDGVYSDGRHPESVEMGSLEDDLGRRDFTMNAIAKAEDGSYIDPFGGRKDMEKGIIRCVGSAFDRFNEDYLRVLRAIRFSVTKDMQLDSDISLCMFQQCCSEGIKKISVERVREELYKAFMFDSLATWNLLERYVKLRISIFGKSGLGLRLKPTLEK